MTNPRDDGYVSKYLVHWTSRKGEEAGLASLSVISRSCRLRLSPNQFFFDGSQRIEEKMVCFTDVPLWHSLAHCNKYGRFGVAFHKSRLMEKGAQPVFYFTHVFKNDMSAVYRFILAEIPAPTIDKTVFQALHRHFYYMQEFSEGPVTDPLANYNEREWRLGEMSLAPADQNFGIWCLNNHLHPCIGRLTIEAGQSYFMIEPSDVAFLIAPRQRVKEVENPHSFDIWPFEDVVETGAESDGPNRIRASE